MYKHWHEIEYKLGTGELSMLGIVRYKDHNWAHGDRPGENCLFLLYFIEMVWKKCRDRSFRHIDLASPPWVMNSRCISEEYHVYTVEREICILRYIISWYHITLNFITSFIIDDIVFYLVVENFLMFDYLYLMKLDR